MKKILIFILVLFTILGYTPTTNLTANASYNESWAVPRPYEITATSNVMVDLSSLSGFSTSKYRNITLYDVEIIALVETKENDLFVYTVEPHHLGSEENIKIIFNYEDFSRYYSTQSTPNYITSINISKTIGDELSIFNYNLSRVQSYYSQYGVFSKYLVEDFEVESSLVRYYEIPSIFSTLTPKGVAVSGNTTEQAYKVASRFKFETQDDGTTRVEFVGTKVITVTSKYCGFVRYKTSSRPSWVDTYYGGGYIDRHFIAFSTDILMDRVLEADVYYSKETRTLKKHAGQVTYVSGTGKTSVTKTLNGELEEVGEEGSSFFGMWVNQKYSFYNIEDITTFSQEFTKDRSLVTFYKAGYFGTSLPEEITEEGLSNISDKQWVLSYEVTDYSEQNSSTTGSTYYDETVCGDVTILRLKFITDGVTYNLGVVDNKTNEDTKPINNVSKGWTASEWSAYRIGQVVGIVSNFFNKTADKMWDKIKEFWDKYKFWIITAIVLILLFIFSPILNLIIPILKFIIKIIIMPFKGIYSILKRHKKE